MPEVGVPRIGVTKVGEVDNTLLPDPVDVVTPVPPLSTAIVVPFHTPVAIVPTEVKEELTTVELSVVPVRVPAAAVTVPDAPRAIAVPFTVIELFDNWAFVIEPKVPPSVRLPELVTVPVSVMPLTVPVPATLVTVPWGLAAVVTVVTRP